MSACSKRAKYISRRKLQKQVVGALCLAKTKARITTALGTFDCTVVSTHFIGTLGKAKIDTQMTIWIAPQIGSIAENFAEKITILGLFTKNSERFIEKLPKEN